MEKSSISRKKFIASLSVLSAAAVCKPMLSDAASLPDETSGMKCPVYLQKPGSDQMTLNWITSGPVYSWVTYGETPDQLDKTARSISAGLVDANNTFHSIRIPGLKAGTTYYYKAYSKEILDFQAYKMTYGKTFSTEVASFTTLADHKPHRELWILNDIHDRPESFNQVMQFHDRSKCDLVFLNGDMFDWQKDEQQLIDHLIDPFVAASAGKLPFILSRGNHETRGVFARSLHQYFNTPEERFYYGFSWGDTYVIVLDSGEDKEDVHEHYAGIVDFDAYRYEQKVWLEQETAKKEFKAAKHRIVFSHIPLFYSGDWHGPTHCREMWADVLNKAKISALISGHTHTYGMHAPKKGQHDYPIVIGGGPKDGKRTLMKLVSDEKELKVIAFDEFGKQLDELKLS